MDMVAICSECGNKTIVLKPFPTVPHSFPELQVCEASQFLQPSLPRHKANIIFDLS